MANATMLKFGYPDSLVRDYEHWSVLLRPAQVTLGSLVLAAKSEATAFGQLPPGAHAELAIVTREMEASLAKLIDYQRINYLMLMMVDPHVHFHVFPRYEGNRVIEGEELVDSGWPGPPDLKSGRPLPASAARRLQRRLVEDWFKYC